MKKAAKSKIRKPSRERMPQAESSAVAGGGISLWSRTGERFCSPSRRHTVIGAKGVSRPVREMRVVPRRLFRSSPRGIGGRTFSFARTVFCVSKFQIQERMKQTNEGNAFEN